MFEYTEYELQKRMHKQELIRNEFKTVGNYQIPLIRKQDIDLDTISLISFSDTKQDDKENAYKTVHFFTYGNFDLRLLHVEAKANNLLENNLVLQIFRKNTDFSQILNHYARNSTNQTLSLVKALKLFKVHPVEPLHDPLSDAKSLLLLYEAFLKSPTILRNEYLKVLTNNPNLEAPLNKLLKKLLKDKSVTLDDLNTFINEEIN